MQTVEENEMGTSVTAIPDEGYVFVKWSDDVTTAQRQELTVTSHVFVYPIFEKIVPTLYTLSYGGSVGGSLQGTALQTVQEGQAGTSVTAIPDDDYVFVKWSDGVTTATRTDENVTANLSVYPVFELATYQIIYQGKTADYTFYYDEMKVPVGQEFTFTAKEIIGYRFVSWSDGITTTTRTDTSTTNVVFVATYEIEPLDTPIIEIVTDGYAPVLSKETYVSCTVSVFNTAEAFCMENVVAGIRGRGNSTWTMPKKPYRIKFDKKTSMFGSDYKAKSWTLIANYADKSLARNAIAQDLADSFDDIAFASYRQFVEVYLNRQYLGVYLLCDQMQTGDGRVEVEEEYDANGDGGYLLELDGRAENEGVENVDWFTVNTSIYAIKTPDTEDETYDKDVHLPFIRSYLESCFTAFRSNDWEQVCTVMDVNSFVDVYIIQELFLNIDCGWTSFYLYKPTGGKLYAGPVWDFDLSSGNLNYGDVATQESCPADGDLYVHTTNPWYKELYKFEEFKTLVKDKLQLYKTRVEQALKMLSPDLDNASTQANGYYSLYRLAMYRNFKRWDILNTPLGQEPDDLIAVNTVEGHFAFLKNWLTTRYEYLCTQFSVTTQT